MAVCNFPQTSPPIGQASASCLQRFTIHFRRPDQLKQKQNAPYKGEYGFDWLRDEYIYPIEWVFYNEVDDPQNPKLIDQPYALCLNPEQLKLEYLQRDIVNPIKPHCQDYYPAWLSIFACNVKGNNADASSNMHKDGVYLDLQLDEIDKIISDGTEIFFEPSDPCLKIVPDKIPISEFLNTLIKKRPINKITGTEISYYLLKNAVKIMCQGDTLKKHGKINVIAKLGECESEVGQLMVYQNDPIGKANIVVVNVITKDKNNKKVIPQSHTALKDLFNYQSFNQAMIKVNIKVTEHFDLVALYNKTKDKDIIDFLNDILDTNYTDSKRTDPNNPLKTIYASGDIKRRLIDLYEKYGKNTPKDNKKIHDEGHYNTYLLFIDVKPTSNGMLTFGSADLRKDNTKYEWGNIFVIYQDGLKDDFTIVHEAAHTFTLPHTFSNVDYNVNPTLNNKHVFYYGYTENYMDYNEHLEKTQIGVNKYKKKMYSFFKWQWNLMRDDIKSIKL
ncbi:hypothetical protein ACFX2U_01520 [Gilliamella apicola]|uniref:hypothetical protein n=1 Tax=Gilliamella apicola TaxID=1196095 RepID=UPI003986B7B5